MSADRNIHSKAMEFMMLAKMGKAKGFSEREIKDAYFTAFILEKKAIERVPTTDKLTKFILMRSAASLAYEADLLEESKILVANCKAENPPIWMREQLDEILVLVAKEERVKSAQAPLRLEGVITNVSLENSQITIQESAKADQIPILIPSNRLTEIVRQFWSKKVQILARKTVAGLMILEDIKSMAA